MRVDIQRPANPSCCANGEPQQRRGQEFLVARPRSLPELKPSGYSQLARIRSHISLLTQGVIVGLITYLISTAIGLGTSVAFWGTGAHSLGLLPPEAFQIARDFGITLPPMPR